LDGVVSKELKAMDKEDAVDFFKRQGVKGTRAEIEEVCRAYGFHPLSLRLLSGMIIRDLRYHCDIKAWTRHNPLPKLVPKEHNILELAYNSLDEKKQRLISRISAFRSPMSYDAVAIFNDFGSEEEFNDALLELMDRGLLFREEKSVKFDMHPIMRGYCYDRLKGKEKVHSRLMVYFATIPESERIESVDDLTPVIELYHHTVRAGGYNAAMYLFQDRLHYDLYYRYGACQTIIELLSALFPDGEDKPPRLKEEGDQAWTENVLANSLSSSGQLRRAMPLYEMANEIDEKRGNREGVAIGLGNLALAVLIPLGKLDVAENNLKRAIEIDHEIKDILQRACDCQNFGLLLAYKGNFENSRVALAKALTIFKGKGQTFREGYVWCFISLLGLLENDIGSALKSAKNGKSKLSFKEVLKERILAEYLLGATYFLKGNFVEAEKYLTEALKWDREINLVELEPDILLEFAKLLFRQNHKEEALKYAEEALQIADRCEYRLKQVDIHNFLAEFYLAADDLEKAKKHGEIAKERAECGYKPALEKAEKLLNEIEQRWK
jgi:tetratricopeptide (TPR) repeat protein